jgi:hypothetical protein
MKRYFLLPLLTIFAVCAVLTSCTMNAGDTARLVTYANTALTVAEIGGVVTPKQAAAVRTANKLILDFQAATSDQRLIAVSNTIIDYAVAEGKLTEEQAAALRVAGTVPLTIADGPANPLLSDVTATK